MIPPARQVWVRAHPRRLPNRDTAPHRELLDAFARDIESRLLENDLAREIEREMAVEEAH